MAIKAQVLGAVDELLEHLESFRQIVGNSDEAYQQAALQTLDVVIEGDRRLQQALNACTWGRLAIHP